MYLNEKLPEVETPAEVDDVGKRLLAAAEYIERRGWCKGALEWGTGEVCAFGAILKVSDGADFRAFGRFTDYLKSLGAQSQNNLNTIAYWNDDPRRTKEQVLYALRAAAKGN